MRSLLLPLLRSRVGIAILIAAVVLVVVGISRLTGDSAQTPTRAAQPEVAATYGSPEPDDGAEGQETAEVPVVKAGKPGPAQVAQVFAADWVKRDRSPGAWLAALKPNATEQLLEQLLDVDPVSVPASKVTGAPQLIPHSAEFAEVELTLDAGVLLLRMVGDEGRWQVDGIDWSRS